MKLRLIIWRFLDFLTDIFNDFHLVAKDSFSKYEDHWSGACQVSDHRLAPDSSDCYFLVSRKFLVHDFYCNTLKKCTILIDSFVICHSLRGPNIALLACQPDFKQYWATSVIYSFVTPTRVYKINLKKKKTIFCPF